MEVPNSGDRRADTAVLVERIAARFERDIGEAPEQWWGAFQPFWRKDAARSASSHIGLGLALVDAYAKLLGIDVKLNLSPKNEISVALTFPVAIEPPDATTTARTRPAPELAAR